MTHSPRPSRSPQVLLAVQDDVSADLLAHRLSRRGLSPVRARHGGEAATQLASSRFDLVVIEMRLPGLTGLELLKRVSDDDVLGTPRIVILGHQGNDDEVVRAFELGAAEYLSRPFSPDVALARITRFLPRESSRAAALGAVPLPAGAVLPLPPVDLLPLLSGAIGLFLLLALLFAIVAAVTHVRARRASRRARRRRARWTQGLLDLLAGDATPEALLDQVPPAQERRFLTFLVPFAATYEGRAQEQIVQLAAPLLSCLDDDLTHRRPGVRARAVQLFGLLGDASARGVLRRRLTDPSLLVTFTAFRWLSRRGTAADADRLLAQLDRLSRIDDRVLSSSLVHLGPAAAAPLRTALTDDAQSTTVRVVCAEALRWMGDGTTADLAAHLLAHEPPPELAAALLRLLRRVGRPEHALRVRPYCHSAVPFVRIHAARALGHIGDPDRDRTRLRRLVTGAASRWVAFNAAQSLNELGETTPLHHLTQTAHPRAALAECVLDTPQ